MTSTITALDETHLPALLAFFEACSSTCFCRYWHFVGTKNDWLERCAHRPEENAAELSAAVLRRDPTGRGVVAIDPDGSVVGWMKLTPRRAVPKLRSLPVYKSLDLGDEDTTYSIGCLLVRPDARGRGIARDLVRAAPSIARGWGAKAVEAYPRRSTEPLHPEEAWMGPEPTFVGAGFEAIVDVTPYPVYRTKL